MARDKNELPEMTPEDEAILDAVNDAIGQEFLREQADENPDEKMPFSVFDKPEAKP